MLEEPDQSQVSGSEAESVITFEIVVKVLLQRTTERYLRAVFPGRGCDKRRGRNRIRRLVEPYETDQQVGLSFY